jgi:translocation and assembly module TamA
LVTLAGQIGVGSILGGSLFSLPADERFYAGGGRSVRGYPYKTISPLRDGHPIGGRSMLELSFELRWKFAENMGMVGFLDGGSAFESSYPDFGEDLLWGAGTGFRYFTPIGPLRVDVGFPLNRRDHLDDSFELYISIGQAF